MDSKILAKLELSRKELLDLGLRNALINHRVRAKQVRVVGERSYSIFRILVTEGRRMTLEALPDERAEQAIADQKDPAARLEGSTGTPFSRNPMIRARHRPNDIRIFDFKHR
jgi:hypothetical protein